MLIGFFAYIQLRSENMDKLYNGSMMCYLGITIDKKAFL